MSKGQNEIMGFAMIVIIVVVVLLMVLSLSIGRGGAVERTNVELSNFLEASMKYTTNCTTSFIPSYETLEGLVKDIYVSGGTKNCLDSSRNRVESTGDALNRTLKEVLGVLNVNETSPNKAYNLTVNYRKVSIDSEGERQINVEPAKWTESLGIFANCSSVQEADYAIASEGGNIIVNLRVCEAD